MSESTTFEPERQSPHVRPDTVWLHAFFELEEGVLPMPHRTITPFMEIIIRQQAQGCTESKPNAGVA